MQYYIRPTSSSYIYFYALVLVPVFTLSVGCDSLVIPNAPVDQESSPTHHHLAINQPEIVSGRIYFEDFEAFGNYLIEIAHADSLPLERTISPHGFRSLLEDTEQLMLDAEDSPSTSQAASKASGISEFEIVEDPYFASVLNKDGEIQIGHDVFKFTRNYAYRISVVDALLLKSISLRQPNHTASLEPQYGRFQTQKIQRSIHTSEMNKTMVSSSCKLDFAKKRRLTGESWVTDYWFYASAGAKSVSQRRVAFWRWVSNSVQRVSLSTTYRVRDSHGVITYGSDIKNVLNGHTAKSVYAQDWGWNATMTGFVRGFHSGRRDSAIRRCNTSVYRAG